MGPFVLAEALMGGGRRMGDQALGVAEVVRHVDQLKRVEEVEGRLLAALDLEGDDVARSSSPRR